MIALPPPDARAGILKDFLATAASLAIGTAGGALFVWLGTPLPWLLGAFAATFLCTVTVGQTYLYPVLRRIVMPIVGVVIGAAFKPEILHDAQDWPAGVAAAGAFTILVSILGYLYFTRIAKWDKATALFASPPGGLAEMLLIGSEFGADERRIVLTHTVRIALVVVLATLTIRFYFGDHSPGLTNQVRGPASIEAAEWLILGGCALVGGYGGARLHLPGGSIFGAMILSAVVHVTGLSHTSPPAWFIAAVQVVLGTSLGVRFQGISRREFAIIISHATAWGLVVLLLALIAGIAVAPVIDFDPRGLFLAFAPGGFSEMLLVALAIGIESAFVATCHTVRLIIIFVGVPLSGSLLKRGWDREAQRQDGQPGA